LDLSEYLFYLPLFSPLAFILGLLACLQKEYAAGVLGILFGIIGILTSPILLALIICLL
jgi:hypothetical protein